MAEVLDYVEATHYQMEVEVLLSLSAIQKNFPHQFDTSFVYADVIMSRHALAEKKLRDERNERVGGYWSDTSVIVT